jgi:hypothetical protein
MLKEQHREGEKSDWVRLPHAVDIVQTSPRQLSLRTGPYWSDDGPVIAQSKHSLCKSHEITMTQPLFRSQDYRKGLFCGNDKMKSVM